MRALCFDLSGSIDVRVMINPYYVASQRLPGRA